MPTRQASFVPDPVDSLDILRGERSGSGVFIGPGPAPDHPVHLNPSKQLDRAPVFTRLRTQHTVDEWCLDVRPITYSEERWRHAGWWQRRQKTYNALWKISTNAKTLHAFANCGSHAEVEWSESRQAARVRCNRCRNRWCAPCAAARSQAVARKLRTLFDGRACTFMTLTLKHGEQGLKQMITRLRECFSALRRRPWFKHLVRGGVATLEVKLSRSNRWHPHLHVMLDAEFLPQRELSKLWLEVTGDSSIVDVRRIPGGQAASYVTKYVSKPATGDVINDQDRFMEMIAALHGARLFNAFGSLRCSDALDTNDSAEEFLPDDWTNIGTLSEVIADPARCWLVATGRSVEPGYKDGS